MMPTVLVLNDFAIILTFTRLVRALRAGLHGFAGAWLRCSSSQWNSHYSSSRLALHPQNRTLQPVQLRFLGSTCHGRGKRLYWKVTTLDKELKRRQGEKNATV
jgi:hypothetical protein